MDALLIVAVASAAITWYAVARARGKLEAIAKPLTLLMLITWLGPHVVAAPSIAKASFLLGLVAAAAGDVLLLRLRRRLAAGMAAFVVTQLAYALALNSAGLPRSLPGLLTALAVTTAAIVGFALIARRARWHKRPWLRPAAVVYTAALGLMLWSALVTPLRSGWAPAAAWSICAGGLLFACSDAVLGWVELVRPSRRKLVLVMVMYHLGQLGLVWGFAQHP